ncbi:F0F1 ATP synthase subunit delta [Floricoccus penangensis]|uniref:ATP synthase subunit delta n=1 Tax=Floricoccus penangensis TaxID=1859475 RepID=A0A9Q5P0V5_9LACT|nr:F0F1 ATP synthase subunit delta [Floricoccus penangensis]OFI47518.1 ATP synthase F1 subunit delta [Floricoccus penangensis]URZ87965.1 F0F1 ATP synthase subunit delta [Floricoccus penangensis]
MSLIVSKRYSKALLEAFADAGKTDELAGESKTLLEVINQSNLMKFLTDESYSNKDKKSIIDELVKNSSSLMGNFLVLLVKNKRISQLEEILQQTLLEIEDANGRAQVEVISAIALSEHQLEKIKEISAQKFNLKDVDLINVIDTTIIGGMIIKSRGKIIDSSIKTQLSKLSQEIM